MSLCMLMTTQGLLGKSSLEKNQTHSRCSKKYDNFFKEKKGMG